MIHAWTYSRYGYEDALELREIECRAPGAGEVRVRIAYASVNPVDWKILKGEQRLFTGWRSPKPDRLFGCDFAGTVVACGSGVPQNVLYSEVFGMTNPLAAGASAGEIVVKLSQVRGVPQGISLSSAGAAPAVGLSALAAAGSDSWEGKKVLLVGAAGGVGTSLIQILGKRGAKVLALAREERHDQLVQLGATSCLDYRVADLAERLVQKAPFDAVMDLHGGFPRRLARRILRRGGLFVPLSLSNGQIPKAVLTALVFALAAKRTRFVLAVPDRRGLDSLARSLAQGEWVPRVDSVHSWADFRSAVARSRSNQAFGKVVIDYGDTHND